MLARVVAMLDDEPREADAMRLAAELATAVGALYGAELGGAADVLARLREAHGVLSGVLARAQGPRVPSRIDEAAERVAASLAILYPVRAGLERELEGDPLADASVQPSADGRDLAAVRMLAAQAPSRPRDPEPREPDAPRASRISVRPVPLVGSRPPAPVESLHRLASEPPKARASDEAGALLPDAALDPSEAGPLLLTRRSAKRGRRRAVELVPDGSGELVDRSSGVSGTGPERRESERVSLEVDIGLHSESQFYAGLSDDVSEGGLFVSTVRVLPVGSELTLSFVLPGGHAVTTRGRVAWLATPRDVEDGTRSGMGVRFVRLEPQHRAAIEAFLRLRPAMLHEV
jgi:uncharacterized protein (TIGR02266 family)